MKIMMIQEFTERTHYEPSFEEYKFIEESYYDFKGGKDDFCKQWLKDKKSGVWDKELNFRQIIRATEIENKILKNRIDEMNKMIGDQIDETIELKKMLRSARNAKGGCYFVMK